MQSPSSECLKTSLMTCQHTVAWGLWPYGIKPSSRQMLTGIYNHFFNYNNPSWEVCTLGAPLYGKSQNVQNIFITGTSCLWTNGSLYCFRHNFSNIRVKDKEEYVFNIKWYIEISIFLFNCISSPGCTHKRLNGRFFFVLVILVWKGHLNCFKLLSWLNVHLSSKTNFPIAFGISPN